MVEWMADSLVACWVELMVDRSERQWAELKAASMVAYLVDMKALMRADWRAGLWATHSAGR